MHSMTRIIGGICYERRVTKKTPPIIVMVNDCFVSSLLVSFSDMTIERQIIAEVSIEDLYFKLLIDEELLWTGKLVLLSKINDNNYY